MRAMKRHAAQDKVFKKLRSDYEQANATEKNGSDNGNGSASMTQEQQQHQQQQQNVTPSWTKSISEAEVAQRQQNETLIRLLKAQLKAALMTTGADEAVEALRRMLSALADRQHYDPLNTSPENIPGIEAIERRLQQQQQNQNSPTVLGIETTPPVNAINASAEHACEAKK